MASTLFRNVLGAGTADGDLAGIAERCSSKSFLLASRLTRIPAVASVHPNEGSLGRHRCQFIKALETSRNPRHGCGISSFQLPPLANSHHASTSSLQDCSQVLSRLQKGAPSVSAAEAAQRVLFSGGEGSCTRGFEPAAMCAARPYAVVT